MSDPPRSPDGRRGELDLIRRIRERAGSADLAAGIAISIGDDAAALVPPPGEQLLVTTDVLVEGRHFILAGNSVRAGNSALAGNPHDDGSPQTCASGFDVGWKTLAVSISDIAAMGGRAAWAVLGVALPDGREDAFADALLDGVLACAAEFGVRLVGGDLSGSPGAVFTHATVFGSARSEHVVARTGARPGDALCVTGSLGGSGARRHLRPIPRQVEALTLVQGGVPHAMIDLSDGLSTDLLHLLDASGVGARIDADRIPRHPDAAAAARADGTSALRHALDDGEDFELLFAVSPERATALEADGLAGTPVTRIGSVTTERGAWLVDSDDHASALERGGHEHFRGA